MSESFVLSVAFLVFGALIIGGEILVLLRKDQGFGPQAVRIVGITIVLSVAAALSAASLSADRLTPVIGLLATIGGYLVGRGESKAEQ